MLLFFFSNRNVSAFFRSKSVVEKATDVFMLVTAGLVPLVVPFLFRTNIGRAAFYSYWVMVLTCGLLLATKVSKLRSTLGF